jgi:hypothetical protein
MIVQSQLVLEEWQDQNRTFYISNDDIHCFVSSQPPAPVMLQLLATICLHWDCGFVM